MTTDNTAHPARTPAPVAAPEVGRAFRDAWLGSSRNSAESWSALSSSSRRAYELAGLEFIAALTPRPEPVVAPLPSEAVEALAEVLAAAEWPDLTWDHIVRWSTPERYRLRARAVLAAGYRLVPEDDEDTVRVALADLVRLKEEPHDDAYRAEKEATWQAVRDALGGRVDEDTVRVPREGLGRLLSTVEREVASILNGDQ